MYRQLLPLVILGLATTTVATPALAYETDVEVRDPSTIVKLGDTYWIYGTGAGVAQFSSHDRLHWTYEGPVFPTSPPWLKDAVPDNKNNIAWAPDVRYFDGLYHLYFAYSTIGSKRSAIGLAVNKTLDPKGWIDKGVAVASGSSTDFNAIDPCIFEDANGKPWLSFGSYFGGVKIMSIDPATGMQSTSDRNIYSVAEHPQSSNNSIEASAVYYHDGYYYLFVNWDACCAGSKSTYNIRIGRSKSVTGPYLDKSGKDMMSGGGSLFLGSVPDSGTGLPFDSEVGPGHAAIFRDKDGYWFSCHYEWARDKEGATTVNIMKLTWGDDGWPTVDAGTQTEPLPSKLTYKITNEESGLKLFASRNDLLQETDDGTRAEVWRIAGNSAHGYRIVNVESKLSVTAPDDAKPGDKISLAKFDERASQLWSAVPAGDGYYRFRNDASNLFLDDPGGSHDEGNLIGLWTENGLPPQAWRLEIQPDEQGIVPGATYKLVQESSDLCLDDPAGSRSPGTLIELSAGSRRGPERRRIPQLWRISAADDGSYTLVSLASNLDAAETSDGSLAFEANGPSPSGHWKITKTDGDVYEIVNQSTGHVLGTNVSVPNPGAKVELAGNGTGASWRWFLERN